MWCHLLLVSPIIGLGLFLILPWSVACCAHHVTDVLPLLGLSAAAAFLAEYRIPFMLVGLATNLIGIGVMSFLIIRQRRCLAECALKAQPAPSAPACH